jgi:hypothetical protein
MSRSDNNWLVPVVLAAGIAIALLFFWPRLIAPPPEPVDVESEPVTEDAPRRPGPLHPIQPLAPPRDGSRDLVPLPPLDDSDAYFRLEIVDIFGGRLEELLTNEALIEKFVATIDNLPRSHIAERIRPVGRLSDNFVAERGAAPDSYRLSAENFDRYRFLVDAIVFADVDSIVDAYRRYYPLFQEAYVGLGYPNGYFNDRVVEVIDHLLATPEPDGAITLARPHVLYEFADPQLEALSSGQKLLLRMGNDNAARAKRSLAELRERIATDQ